MRITQLFGGVPDCLAPSLWRAGQLGRATAERSNAIQPSLTLSFFFDGAVYLITKAEMSSHTKKA